MGQSQLQVSRWRAESGDDQFLALGYACALASVSSVHQANLTWRITAILQPAIVHAHLDVYFNDDKAPVGYLAWASMSEATLGLCQEDATYLPHISEWHDGNELALIDLCAPHGNHQYMIDDFSRGNKFTILPSRRLTAAKMEFSSHFGSQHFSQFEIDANQN
jgi:cytolysin-activating lysine-acyltransferase